MSPDDITGPIANIQRNVEAATLSLGCNLDQQVRHFHLLWRHAIRPVVSITQALMVIQLLQLQANTSLCTLTPFTIIKLKCEKHSDISEANICVKQYPLVQAFVLSYANSTLPPLTLFQSLR